MVRVEKNFLNGFQVVDGMFGGVPEVTVWRDPTI